MDRSRRPVLIGLLFVAAVAASRDLLQSPDALSYAVAVRDGRDLVHPHHVLYGPLARLIATLPGLDALRAGQIVNTAAALALFAAAWHLASRRARGIFGAVIAVAALAATRAVLVYTVRMEVYLPLLAATAWLTVVTAGREDGDAPPSPERLTGAAVLLGVAALCHQLGALWAVPLLAAPWAPLRDRAATVAGGGVLALCGTYAGFLASGAHDVTVWTLSYALAPVEAWGSTANLGLDGLRALALGYLRLFVPVPAAAATPAAIGAWALLAVLLAVSWRAPRDRVLRRFAAVAMAVQVGFAAWWLPWDSDFALIGLWPLGILLGTAVRDALRDRAGTASRTALMLGVAGLAAITLLGTIPNLQRRAREAEARVRTLDAAVPAGAVVAADYGTQQLLRWYGRPRVVIEMSELGGAAVLWRDETAGVWRRAVP